MSLESTFSHDLKDPMWGTMKGSVEDHKETLPKYEIALNNLAKHISSKDFDGVIVLGYSAANMWIDLERNPKNKGLKLPDCKFVLGQENWNLYSGFSIAESTYQKLNISFKRPILVEDFATSGRKVEDLNAFFKNMKLPISYAFLVATDKARVRMGQQNIRAYIATNTFDSALAELLQLRNTPSMKL